MGDEQPATRFSATVLLSRSDLRLWSLEFARMVQFRLQSRLLCEVSEAVLDFTSRSGLDVAVHPARTIWTAQLPGDDEWIEFDLDGTLPEGTLQVRCRVVCDVDD